MVGYIYLTTDTTNGMQYVGQHHYNKKGELDPNYHGSGIIISRIYKERPETLKEEYLKTCYSDSEMNDDEKYYIKLYDTLWPNGYNLSEGGDGGVPCEETRRKISNSLKGLFSGEKHPMFGKHQSEESRRKMSSSHKGLQTGEKHPFFGKHHSEESKKKMSQTKKGLQSGEKHPMFGKHHSEESKKKMSDKKKGIPNEKLSKKVLQFTLTGEFIREWPSAAECGRNGFDRSSVSACCRGKLKSHKGYIFQYKD